MSKFEILEKIKNTILSVLKHDDFEMRDDLTASDVPGWDSLSHINIISEIEDAFGIRFKLKELNKMKNMGTLVALVQSKV